METAHSPATINIGHQISAYMFMCKSGSPNPREKGISVIYRVRAEKNMSKGHK
jgi:hypothetical protein